MPKYEITFLFDKGNKQVLERLKKYISESKAKVIKEEDWGVKTLEYQIKKHKEASYLYYEIELDTKSVRNLEEKIKLEEELLRYLVVRAEK